ncbi:MAG: hypothetical protein SCK29_11115 [Bacillota bacterium]|nr:hypothetical protein [Bacillota bacterium]MDW7684654.1 hypothetical protein [Bacillota bacterium]
MSGAVYRGMTSKAAGRENKLSELWFWPDSVLHLSVRVREKLVLIAEQLNDLILLYGLRQEIRGGRRNTVC